MLGPHSQLPIRAAALRLFAAVAFVALAGCAATPPQPSAAPDEAQDESDAAAGEAQAPATETVDRSTLPNQELTENLLYELLLAEIAGQRGNAALSAQAYVDLAKRTRDPRIARRATEVALYARMNNAAIESATVWHETEPGSTRPLQALAGLLVAAGRVRQRPRKRIHAADPHACQCAGQAGRSEARAQSRRRLSQARRIASCRRAGGSQRGRRTGRARGSPQGRTAAAGLGGARPARSATAAEGLGGSGRDAPRRLFEKISCRAGDAPRLRAPAGGAKTLRRGPRRVPEAHGRRSRQQRRGLRRGAAFLAAQGLRRRGEISQEPDREPLPRQGRGSLVSRPGRRRAEESSGGAPLVR